MNWTKDKSLLLSQGCVLLFAALLLALDVGAPWLARWLGAYGAQEQPGAAALLVCIYAGSVFAWLCLWELWRLLGAIRRGLVFTEENVRAMRRVSWCCVGAAAVALCAALWYPSMLVICAAAGFMALIVRIVKNAFQQAMAMKDELDLTV
ncbi:MAG: DUF2975 domain-containing protein [Oscillospiraceae bacterium]|nr:DUF2975 domain-containing protein [Oscillospiraceae bacterium]